MAVYFNLTVDCGSSPQTAKAIAEAFGRLTIPIANAPPVKCQVDRDRLLAQERVSVWPIGWGRDYRVALYGWETQDTVEFGEVIEEENLNLPGYIFAESILPKDGRLRRQPEFSPGYRWNPDQEGRRTIG